MSNLSPIDKDLYLIYPRLLPVSFLKYLSDMNIDFITVPEVEYKTMGCNVLAIEPRKVIMLDGNPITKKRLENHNVEVHCYDGSEISLKDLVAQLVSLVHFIENLNNDKFKRFTDIAH